MKRGNGRGKNIQEARADVRRRTEQLENESKALKLRIAGFNFEDIGANLDPPVTAGLAERAYRRALGRVVREQAAEVVALEHERLNQLTTRFHAKAITGDTKAASIALEVMKRRAAYDGLDKPADLKVHEVVRGILDVVASVVSEKQHREILAKLGGLGSAEASGALRDEGSAPPVH